MNSLEQLMLRVPEVLPEKPLWSSDGREVFFYSGSGSQPEFWAVAVADGRRRPLTQAIGGLPFLATREARCSPDGRWLAFLTNRADRSGEGRETELWLQPLAPPGPLQRLTRLGSMINSVSWAPDSRSLALASTRHGRFDIFVVELETQEARRLTSHADYEVYPSFTPDGQGILFVRLNRAWTDHQLWLMDRAGGNQRLIAEDVNFFDYHYGRSFGYPLPAPGGGSVLFRSQRSGWINYWSAPLGLAGSPQPLVAADADQSEASWSPQGDAVAYIENHNGNLQLRVVDVQLGTVNVLAGAGQGVCMHPAWSPDGQSLAYLYGSPTSPLSLRVVDLERRAQGHIQPRGHRCLAGPANDDWSPHLVEPEKVFYPTFDGRSIPAYLYRPQTPVAAGSCPGLLWIHGGPTSQFSDTYQPQVQYFVSRGYVVLLPNIRGSSGYGREFEDLNNADWGGDDLRDVVAGAEYLQTLPQVNSQRLGIHGTSYGGCMSMSAVVFAPTVFQAAIPHGGYADWVHMYDEQELRHVQLLRYELGTPQANPEVYYRCSPYYQLDRLETPTLILHGAGRVPASDASRRFYEEARRLYKPVRYKVYPDECYYVGSGPGVSAMLGDMLEFFDEHLKDS